MLSKVLLCCLVAYAAGQALPGELPATPYSFSHDNTDEFGTRITREETSDENNNKVGSYSYTDPNGITRTVRYVADADGFRVTVETNEPGTKTSNPADAPFYSNAVEPPPAPAAPRPVQTAAVVRPATRPYVVQSAPCGPRPARHTGHFARHAIRHPRGAYLLRYRSARDPRDCGWPPDRHRTCASDLHSWPCQELSDFLYFLCPVFALWFLFVDAS